MVAQLVNISPSFRKSESSLPSW